MKLLATILFLVFAITSCDLFVTRDAEDPSQSRSNFQTAYQAEIVIQNLKNSFADKDAQNYAACFVDNSFSSKNFSFQPTSEALSQYQFLGTDWSVNDERQYFNSVITRTPEGFPITLNFSDESLTRSGDTVVYSAAYSISVPSRDSETTQYQGNVQFNMVNDSRTVWVIYFWQDIKSSEIFSWSELKGQYY